MRDVSKILSEAELLKLRSILASTPSDEVDEGIGEEYPKMLFHALYVPLYQVIKQRAGGDVIKLKEAKEAIRKAYVVVDDWETEEDYLTDVDGKGLPQWFTSHKDAFVAVNGYDPTVPTGREGRRAKVQNEADRKRRLRELRREYAQLTGGVIEDEVAAITDGDQAAPLAGSEQSDSEHSEPAPAAAAKPRTTKAGKPATQAERRQQVTQRARQAASARA